MALVRLQKYFTDCGVMSRRAAEEQIRLGNVKVNGTTASIGALIDTDVDKVELDGKIILPTCDEKVCIMLNKPRGFVTTMSDERDRRNVSMLVSDLGIRVYPIGRLDMNSDGLLLMTNDGELANKLTHPRHEIPKIYHVTVRGTLDTDKLRMLGSAMVIDGYKILPVKVNILKTAQDGDTVLEMTLFEGRNRQIRKMCGQHGLRVVRLCRVAIGNIKLGSLPEGRWRRLSQKEIAYLLGDHTQKKGIKNA